MRTSGSPINIHGTSELLAGKNGGCCYERSVDANCKAGSAPCRESTVGPKCLCNRGKSQHTWLVIIKSNPLVSNLYHELSLSFTFPSEREKRSSKERTSCADPYLAELGKHIIIIKHPKGCSKFCFRPSVCAVRRFSVNLIFG